MKPHTFTYALCYLDDYLNGCRSEFYNTEESLHNLEKINDNIGDILDYPDATLEEKNKIRKQMYDAAEELRVSAQYLLDNVNKLIWLTETAYEA